MRRVISLVAALLFVHALLAGQAPAFTLTSSAFKHNAPLPLPYTGYGDFKSPPLAWSGAPKTARSFALVLDDPDVPIERFSVHWLLYNIPATITRVPEGAKPADPKAPRVAPIKGAAHGLNALKRLGYLPPRPFANSGLHHYTFTLYALDADLKLAEGLSKEELLAAMKGHIVGEAKLVGLFERKEP